MENKSIRGIFVLLMLILLIVDAGSCPCDGSKDTNDLESDCMSALECLEDHQSECSGRKYDIIKSFIKESECQLSKICGLKLVVPVIQKVLREGNSEELTKDRVVSILTERYPCIIEQEENNKYCKNRASAKRCFRKVFENSECVEWALEYCKIDDLYK